MQTDVLIVGAGPTGLSLACQCIRHGIDFIVIDQKDGVTPFSKALGVHARTLEIYEQLGLAEKAVSEGNIAGKVRLLEGGQVRGEMDMTNLGAGLSPYPFMLVLEQSRNEALLYDYVKAHGKDVRWNTELIGLTQNETSVSAEVRDASGESEIITAKYLVGCDGPRSPVRHALGLTFEGSTFERLFYVADVHLDWEFSHDALHVCLAPESVLAFFPMSGEDRWRIVGAFPDGFPGDPEIIPFEQIEADICTRSEIPLQIKDVQWFSVYKVHSRHVDRFSEGCCFLAGDAAHIHTPAGGQGMNTGIQDAYNLAWKLAYVLQGKANARILETYNQERLENAKRLLQTTDRMFNAAAGTDWLLNFIRTTIFPPLAKYILGSDVVRRRFFPMISQIGIHYRDSELSEHIGENEFRVAAGDRLPYFTVDGASIYDRLHAPTFHLLHFTGSENDEGATELAVIEQDFGSLLDQQTVPFDPHISHLFGSEEPFFAFVRPDNHIALLCHKNVREVLQTYVRERLS